MDLSPLTDRFPLDLAMSALVPSRPAGADILALAEHLSAQAMACGKLAVAAGIWLYVDDLARSHGISQGIPDATGSYWHAIMHRREADFANSKYWLRQAGDHPVWKSVTGYEPYAFVDEVARHHAANPAHLVALQRAEWSALMAFSMQDSA